jgi:hypothetical protein
MIRQVGLALSAVGVLGFFGAVFLPYAGSWLDGVELPTFFETNTIALQDGGRLTATMPTQRVQHYDSDGRFRNGWFVDAKGGYFAIGLTDDGRVAVCTSRGSEIFLFDLDGRSVGRQVCSGTISPEISRGGTLQPSDFPSGELNLQRAIAVDRPKASLVPILLVPLWHPFVAVFFGLAGGLALELDRRSASQSPAVFAVFAPLVWLAVFVACLLLVLVPIVAICARVVDAFR